MNKIKRSSKLLKAAFAVLFREKKLLLFPLMASVLTVAVALFFVAPIALQPTGYSYASGKHWAAVYHACVLETQPEVQADPVKHTPYHPAVWHASWWVAPLSAVVYFVSMFLATFSNVAFYHEIMQALNGQSVSIQRGFRFAAARWRAVLLWSLFAGLVGYLINAIEQRVGFLGKIIASLLGFAWSVACIFIIPTLVRDTETANPIRLLQNSAGTLKHTWGELILGFVGLELAFGMIFMGLLLFAILFFGAAGFYFGFHFHLHYMLIFLAGIGAMLVIAVPLSWISSVVNPIYRCALYIYATEGVVPGTFDKELLDSAWKVKKA